MDNSKFQYRVNVFDNFTLFLPKRGGVWESNQETLQTTYMGDGMTIIIVSHKFNSIFVRVLSPKGCIL